MKLSVSNIAWKKEDNEQALAILQKHGIKNLEIAPNLLFEDIPHTSKLSVQKVKNQYQKSGFNLVAMQSLLYGAKNYSIFDNSKKVSYLLDYLAHVFRIANLLGVRNLVFGSPKNRFMSDVKNKKNEVKAFYFFRKLCRMAQKNKTYICMEANSKEYGCNFITNTFEAVEFIKRVNHPNFMLNFDIGTTVMNKENLGSIMKAAGNLIRHVHISAPYLEPINNSSIDHNKFSNLIRQSGYKGFISLEMKAGEKEFNAKILEKSLNILTKFY